MSSNKLFNDDCFNVEKYLAPESIDLIYLDPPFFTQRIQTQRSRDGMRHFSFKDIWESDDEYSNYIYQRLVKLKSLLKDTGSIFFHCDKSASHIVRLMLDSIFGEANFRSEIIWYFKRWSNSKKGLLPAHQTIFFYSRTSDFKFNKLMQAYSLSTNVDQIMQKRARDSRGKSVYARDENEQIISSGAKKGVPLSDVWEIPFLNPKAKERIGYPTQKPVLLLDRIIELTTSQGDLVLDPFCGSGTTLVSANHLGRNSIGFDISKEAITICKERLKKPVITASYLMKNGRESYQQHSKEATEHLAGIEYVPVQRNSGIDGLLKNEINGNPVFIRVQRQKESVIDAVVALKKAATDKGECELILIKTHSDPIDISELSEGVFIIPSTTYLLGQYASEGKENKVISFTKRQQNSLFSLK